MKLEGNISYQNDNKKISKLSFNVIQRSINYWKDTIGFIGESLKIPGQLKEPEKNMINTLFIKLLIKQ